MAKLINLSDLFKNTWTIYREKFTLIVGLMALPFLLMAVGQMLLITGSRLLPSIINLVAGVGILWGVAGLLLFLRDRSQPLTIKDAYRLGWGKLLALVWVAILTTFIVGGGFALFVIPGIILAIWLVLAQMLVVIENEKGMMAIIKSREYVRDYFWPILGRYLGLFVAIFIAYIILTIITTIISSLFSGLGSSLGIILNSLLMAIVNILIAPVAVIYTYLVYENLKQVKEGVVVVDPAKKQKIWYLVVGLIGWLIIIVISVLVPIIMGLFISQLFNGLPAQSTGGPAFLPKNLPAGLTPEQQQQVQTQMETLKKLQDQFEQMKALPPN